MVGQRIAGNPVHPGFETTRILSIRLIRVTVSNHTQEDFVNQVLGGGLPACQAKEEAKQRSMTVFVDLVHAGNVAARDRRHPFMVGVLARGVHPYSKEN